MKKISKSNRGNEKDQLCLLLALFFFYDRRTEKENRSERSFEKVFNVNEREMRYGKIKNFLDEKAGR